MAISGLRARMAAMARVKSVAPWSLWSSLATEVSTT